MRILLASLMTSLVLFSAQNYAIEQRVLTAKSPAHRAVLFELYTSEGCSSCPPADKWLSSLKHEGVSGQQLIPLAFHVTYWDYIGWQDRFASERHDERQRRIAGNNRQSTIYTPQFVLNGDDYRAYNQFAQNLGHIIAQTASVDLKLTARVNSAENVDVEVEADISRSKIKDVAIYLAVFENDLSSQVEDGENEGESLHHDFVVRQLYGPYIRSMPEGRASIQQDVTFEPDWKNQDIGLVAFAQNPHTGEVLQAVYLDLDGQD